MAIPFRYGMTLLSVALLALCGFSSFFRERTEWLLRTLINYILITVAIITAASEAQPNYVAGYFLCLLALSMMPQPLWNQWGITIFSIGLYFALCAYFGVEFDTVAKRYGLQDTISVFLVTLICGYAMHRMRRELYEQAFQLREKGQELEKVLGDRTEKLEATYQDLKESLENERKKEVELEYYEDVMTKMSDRVHEDKERERLDIADHIHGTVGQDLAISKQKIDELLESGQAEDMAQGLRQLSQHIKSAISDTRLVVRNMNLRVLKEYGLRAALEELFLSVKSVQKLQVKYHYHDRVFEGLSEELSQHLFRATQELLNNIVKYAKVEEAFFSLFKREGKWVMSVSDDGIGTENLKPELRQDGGFGLYRMQERTLDLGGEFMMKSAPNEGLVVTLSFPMTEVTKV